MSVPQSAVIVTPESVELGIETAPVSASWILDGTPLTRTKFLLRSSDWLSNIVVWECTAGQFEWHYSNDETLFVISGEAFITINGGEERRLGPGDLGFFPAGSSCVWRVPDCIKKFALNREPVGGPLGFFLKGGKKLLRMTGLLATV